MGDSGDLSLLGHPSLAGLGKAGGEDDGRADLALGQAPDRVEHGHARNGQQSDIHAPGQVLHRLQTGPCADLVAFGIDQVNSA